MPRLNGIKMVRNLMLNLRVHPRLADGKGPTSGFYGWKRSQYVCNNSIPSLATDQENIPTDYEGFRNAVFLGVSAQNTHTTTPVIAPANHKRPPTLPKIRAEKPALATS